MNHHEVPIAASVLVALAWLPVLLRFFRSWRIRNNPISFAICMLVLFALYMPVFAIASFDFQLWPLATILTLNTMVCITFYVTFRLSDRKFHDARKHGG